MLNLFPLQRRRKLRRRLNLNRKMTTWALVSSIRLRHFLICMFILHLLSLTWLLLYLHLCNWLYFQILYNHCGYTVAGVVTGNGWHHFESVRFGNPVCAGHTGLLTYASSDTSVIIFCNSSTKKHTY